MNEKNIPMRRCVGCFQSRPKDELTRYTLTKDGYVMDIEKIAPGRGVYICTDSPECYEKAKKRKRI